MSLMGFKGCGSSLNGCEELVAWDGTGERERSLARERHSSIRALWYIITQVEQKSIHICLRIKSAGQNK